MKRLGQSLSAVVIDTETTGLGDDAQIVEISVVSVQTGDVLFHSLVRPIGNIPSEATAIHGITNSMVKSAPQFPQIIKPLFDVLHAAEEIIIYNADYDSRLFIQSYERSQMITTCETRQLYFVLKHELLNASCAMLWYAAYFGEWNEYREDFKWQSLSNACRQQGVDVSGLEAHRATADCEMTRRLLHAVDAKIESIGA